jgi:VanZ family protein
LPPSYANASRTAQLDFGVILQTLKILAWLSVLAIVALSLVPGYLRPSTLSSARVEHFLAYAGAAFLFGIAYSSLRERASVWGGLAAVSVVLEVLQGLVPGRSPHILDALASTTGLTIGLLSGAVVSAYCRAVMRRKRLPTRLP